MSIRGHVAGPAILVWLMAAPMAAAQGLPPTGASVYGDEIRDFGVPPQDSLQSKVGTPTPLHLPGGGVITTSELHKTLAGGSLHVIDAWDDGEHARLPGAIFLPFAGTPGGFDDATQQRLREALAPITGGDPQAPLVFYCISPLCWESYNAALRAIHLGYRNVLWYRGGIVAWRAAGLPLLPPGAAPP